MSRCFLVRERSTNDRLSIYLMRENIDDAISFIGDVEEFKILGNYLVVLRKDGYVYSLRFDRNILKSRDGFIQDIPTDIYNKMYKKEGLVSPRYFDTEGVNE